MVVIYELEIKAKEIYLLGLAAAGKIIYTSSQLSNSSVKVVYIPCHEL